MNGRVFEVVPSEGSNIIVVQFKLVSLLLIHRNSLGFHELFNYKIHSRRRNIWKSLPSLFSKCFNRLLMDPSFF